MTTTDNTAPAALLTAAAEKLRALAADATPGPWAVDNPKPRYWGHDPEVSIIGGGKPLALMSSEYNGALNGAYAAAMHPGVALALADWLDGTAAYLAGHVHPGWQDMVGGHALAVARAILGEEAQR